MTINNPELYMAGVWDWQFLNECFRPTRIKVMDIDGFVERNGRFLVIETKRSGAEIPTGELISFRQLVKQGHWVLIIWGYQKEPVHDLLLMTPSGEVRYSDEEKETIQDIVHDWYRWADKQGPFVPDGLRPFLDTPLAPDEYQAAFDHVRQFNVKVVQTLAGNGRFKLSVK